MSREDIIQIKKFRDLNLQDPFFTSLKNAYQGFEAWFSKKGEEQAYVVQNDSNAVEAFLYLKFENGNITDITPPLMTTKCLKVGTFKINAHGTKLGERFVKKIMDHALCGDVRHIYVTVFPEHEGLISILEQYGFSKYGTKESSSGIEDVYLKDMTTFARTSGFDCCLDYPLVYAHKKKKWILGIKPEFHTKLFPDSILKNENSSIINDVSYANSIHKAYLGSMWDIPQMNPGDEIIIYRTSDIPGRARFRSVATSLCVLEEKRSKGSFSSEQDFIEFAQKYSIFSTDNIRQMYRRGYPNRLHILKMTYNVAFPKRPNLGKLIEEAGLPEPGPGVYYGLMELEDEQFSKILELGEVYEGIVID